MRFLREQTISQCKSKELEMFFFQGAPPTPSSLHRQCQRHILVLSKPNDTNTATTRLHNHAVFSNEMKQQTGHVLLMFSSTCTNDFLNQQAMSSAKKSRALFNLQLDGQMKLPFKYTHGCQRYA